MLVNLESAPEALESAPEAKGTELTDAFGDFMSAFESFKEANDERLAEIETRMGADVVTREKVERISKAVDELSLKKLRPTLSREGVVQADEHKAAFEAYIRSGDDRRLRSLDTKAMSYGSGQDGGYLVPAETEAEIGRRLSSLSPVRALATVRQVSSAVLKKPYAVTGPSSGWVSETSARPQTNSPNLAEMQFPTMELYAMPAATQTLLDDAVVDLDSWIGAEVESAFAEQESAAFVNGDGINKPRGFLDYPTVAEDSWTWDNIGALATGVDGGLPASNASDKLIDLVYALKAGYRQNASWMMNRKVQASVRKLKDADGNYLWTPPAAAGASATLMGFPIAESEDMPDAAAGSLSIAFGDFARGYLVVDRTGVRVLRDPYSAKPYVLFYTTKRVGGGVQDFAAIKLLKFGTA